MSQFTHVRLNEPTIRELMKKVKCHVENELDKKELENKAFGAKVRIRTKKGDSFECVVEVPRGYTDKTPPLKR